MYAAHQAASKGCYCTWVPGCPLLAWFKGLSIIGIPGEGGGGKCWGLRRPAYGHRITLGLPAMVYHHLSWHCCLGSCLCLKVDVPGPGSQGHSSRRAQSTVFSTHKDTGSARCFLFSPYKSTFRGALQNTLTLPWTLLFCQNSNTITLTRHVQLHRARCCSLPWPVSGSEFSMPSHSMGLPGQA